jgi:hypothetical protein
MFKNGSKSPFVYWSLIWACLMGNLGRAEGWQIMGFDQSSMEVEFFHKLLKIHLVLLGLQGTEEGSKWIYASKLFLNPKIGIMTTLHQFRDRPARA